MADYATNNDADNCTSLAGIAEVLGYANGTSFSRAFKRVTGITLAAYRKENGSDQATLLSR
jgi:AraC-like DNA-binding protein